MNKLVVVLFAILPGVAFSQLSTLPPSSSTDGVVVGNIGVNSGASRWENPNTLGAYRFASDGNLGLPNMKSPDNVLGLSWNAGAPSAFSADWQRLNATGGTIRMIFVGESAGWLNDFGYTYSGNPTGPGSFTGFRNISAGIPNETIRFGDHLDVTLAPGEPRTFDFWFNGVGASGVDTSAPNSLGGVYTLIHPENSTPFLGTGNALWAQSPILVNTWIPATSSYTDVATYLVGLEDWRSDRSGDGDGNDFFLGFQIYFSQGTPLDPEAALELQPVPEPATYGALAALGLLGIACFRARRRSKK